MGMEWPPRGDLKVVVLTIVLVVISNGVSAIEKSDTGAGQYLIVPLAIAANGYETVLEISDTPSTAAQALKLRVLDRDGQPRLTANLYLKRGATWAGGLTRQEGTARLLTASDSCLLIERDDAVEPSNQVDFEFTAGSVEVVEMGVVDSQTLQILVSEGDCEAIADLWNDQAWAPHAALAPPSGGLKATARVVNVGKGTFYGVPATALAEFSDIAQHTAPGTAQPDLASTHDAGTEVGETRSVVCDDDGCVEDFWDNPIDAASAALMTYTARDTYDISESLNARSEWILTFPTVAYYEDDQSLSGVSADLTVTNRSGVSFVGVTVGQLPGVTVSLQYDQSVGPIDLTTTESEVGMEQTSRLFGLDYVVQSPGATYSMKTPDGSDRFPAAGQVELRYDCGLLVASSGRWYSGCPALTSTFTEYTNGLLPGDGGLLQRANYGSSGETSTTVRIQQPPE